MNHQFGCSLMPTATFPPMPTFLSPISKNSSNESDTNGSDIQQQTRNPSMTNTEETKDTTTSEEKDSVTLRVESMARDVAVLTIISCFTELDTRFDPLSFELGQKEKYFQEKLEQARNLPVTFRATFQKAITLLILQVEIIRNSDSNPVNLDWAHVTSKGLVENSIDIRISNLKTLLQHESVVPGSPWAVTFLKSSETSISKVPLSLRKTFRIINSQILCLSQEKGPSIMIPY